MDLDILRSLNKPIFYVTNDVSKGIGLENVLPNYHIICLDDHPLVDILQKAGVSIFCLERVLRAKNIISRSSGTILSHPAVLSFIQEKSESSQANILFFKPQKRIEITAMERKFNLLGNSVEINRSFEDKVEFFKLCQKERISVPDGEVLKLAEANFSVLAKKYGEVLVVQFGRGWAGNSTFFIGSEQDWQGLQEKYGQISVKIGRFIEGKTVLNNAVIFRDQVLISEPALQIKADKNLTSTQAGTGGRQWPAGLSFDQKEEIKNITLIVGNMMKLRDYQGFFGLDFLIDKETGKVLLSENNARLTASVPFYTKLELQAGAFPLLGYHLLSFLPGIDVAMSDFEPSAISGGEIVARNTGKAKVKVGGSMATGIYTKSLDFKKESYFLETSETGDFWLETVAQGRIVNPEIEIVKLDTLAEVCSEEGIIHNEYLKIFERVKEQLEFKKCQD